MRTMLAFAVACALLGGCAIAPYDDDDYLPERHYGEVHGDRRLHRDPIPYRDDGDYHRGSYDRDGDVGHHDTWR